MVTFLFTDVEGSTRRWEADAEGMRVALAAHDEVLCKAIEGHGGWLLKRTGDGVCAAFASPRSAVDASGRPCSPWTTTISQAFETGLDQVGAAITQFPVSVIDDIVAAVGSGTLTSI